ncbi:MAG: type I DNA topoisomerase [Acidimicrobiia bacterium]|nr:type I DNA topoisomerase [Acidimicrobiia bacterium]
MSQKLVIVESPAKARTISGYLGEDFVVESSIGHIRDIPAKAADAPKSLQDEWRRTRYGVDVDNDFKPLYVVSPDKKQQVTKLKRLLKDADELYLATDEDREGEAIAWHLIETLNPRVPVRRMVFHEITPAAIAEAADHPRELDRRLVDAQEARRILDRLYGYEVSPVLWRKIKRGLSAGRVQSPATRIIVDRERERMAFVAATYWDLDADFDTEHGSFAATLVSVDGMPVATGRDFDEQGKLKGNKKLVIDEERATSLAADLVDVTGEITSVESKPYTRRPYPPFRTSTLQQEAGRKLRFGARRTMSAAQRLYEGGFITYMRTDSLTLSDAAIGAARSLVADRYGAEYLPNKPRLYTSKVKNAQEAHEAIRPAGDDFKSPKTVAAQFGPSADETRLYDLIWKRTVASQMKDAKGESIKVTVGATSRGGSATQFAASGTTILFPGFLRAYVEGSDDPEAALDDQERILPPVTEGEPATASSVEPKGHETKPPARYTEASLIKRLEELSIGRPSTYASIISTIQDRGYAYKKGAALVPTFTAFAAVALMEQHFSDLVDYAFTARMEDDLDEIANGNREAIPWLKSFYFGNGHAGLKNLVSANIEEIDAREINAIPIGEDEEGRTVVARSGKFGPYVQRGEETASIPNDLAPDELTVAKAIEFLEAPNGDRILGVDPETGLDVTLRNGRFGAYVQLGEQVEGSSTKPKRASLFKGMDEDSIGLEQALRLLSLPRVVGQHPEDGVDITAQNGRYGPYLSWGKETRSLETEEQLFTVDLNDAVRRFKEEKRRGRRAATPPLRELGDDPNSGKPVVIKDGRFGPYVTDGETNASLRVADTIEGMTIDRAAELLQLRRERVAAQGGSAKGRKKATGKKKAAKKKS